MKQVDKKQKRENSINIKNILMYFIVLICTISACDKNELLEQVQPSKQHKELNNLITLPTNYYPYTYAVPIDTFEYAYNYMMSVFDNYQEGDAWGYFVLSLSNDSGYIYIAYITETQSEYDITMINHQDYPYVVIGDPNNPSILVDNDEDGNNDDNVYAVHRTFRHAYNMEQWIARRQNRGYVAKCVGSDKHGRYVCISYR